MRSVFFFLQLSISSAFPWQTKDSLSSAATHLLRGRQTSDKDDHVAKVVELRGGVPRGHFFYARGCSDCFYKGSQCGCGPAMEYLACLTKHCYTAEEAQFGKMCSVLQNHCSGELDLSCQKSETACQSKFNQLSSGGPGLSWDQEEDFAHAFCGPYGKCIGELHMHVNVHEAELYEEVAPATAKAATTQTQAPPIQKSAAVKPCDEPISLKVWGHLEPKPIWVECGIPLSPDAKFDSKADWSRCTAQVQGAKASCNIPMTSQLEAHQAIESYCVLTSGDSGRRISQPLWRSVKNKHTSRPVQTSQGALETDGAFRKTSSSSKQGPFEIDKQPLPKDRQPQEVVTIGDAEKALDAGDVVDDMDGDKLPWMKGKYDSRPPLPWPNGGRMTRHAEALNRETREEASRRSAQLAKESAEVENATEKTGSKVSKNMAEVRQEAAKDMREDMGHAKRTAARPAKKVASSSDEVSHELEKAKKVKPPYMKNKDTEDKEPVPEVLP